MALIEQTEETTQLAERFLRSLPFAAQSTADAFHIALACTAGMDVLLSWNCKHIANPYFMTSLRKLAEESGYNLPILCTPYALIGE